VVSWSKFGGKISWQAWPLYEEKPARMKLDMIIRGYVMAGPAVYGVDRMSMAPRMFGMQVQAVINNCFLYQSAVA